MTLDQNSLIALGIGLVAIVGLAFALLGFDGGGATNKRVQSLSGNAKQAKRKTSAKEQTRDRRKTISDSLKKIEDKQKEANQKKKVSLDKLIEQAGFDFSVRDFWTASAIVAVVMIGIGYVSGQNALVILAMGIVGGLGIPRWFLYQTRRKRQKKFENEFSNAIDVIVRGVKSGLPVNECLKIISRDAQSPVKEEFQLLVEGQRIGLTLEQSLERLYNRMPISDVNFFAIVLVIQQQTGGNLADALGNLSTVLRSRKTMLGKIAALSMEAKASAAILAAMPFFVSGLVYLAAPDYIAPLFSTQTGQFMLMGAGMWMLIGIVVMKNMISIKV
ncbi:hypothetical protein PB2503_05392 [Parvularcula bermudensis HTCC2503]|uniref:Type II secretion system protein GspF domain-containing protein n=1 Tax=Parvularcula bermudensis (strain ATCC BAA-594 / HTCC2503 / KCTC 12087) TaxID=314260 RepID=E0TGA9_PARBH|nr:type II secretion system F family protein [Parvularcula bermudensis]ADM09152.1 hypothetical protein PB2503_05392 [Parvularcula bermudensis HTCC2503]